MLEKSQRLFVALPFEKVQELRVCVRGEKHPLRFQFPMGGFQGLQMRGLIAIAQFVVSDDLKSFLNS